MMTPGDHSRQRWIEEPYRRTSEVTETVDMCYIQLGGNCKLPAAQQTLQYRSFPRRHGC